MANLRSYICITLAQVALLLFASTAAHADIDATMYAMSANILSNYTPGTAYQSQTMGVIAGPSFYARNKVANVNLVNFQPPSIKASCSGIDAFAGSFSFISAAELVTFLRRIAANAVPYAFNIALSTLCKDCQHHMATLQKMAQELNSHNYNSCEVAKRIVDGSGLKSALESVVANRAAEEGVTTDYQEARFGRTAISAEVAEKMPALKAEFEGNVGWRILKDADLPSWFGSSGDDSAAQVMLGFTGTWIKAYRDSDTGGKQVLTDQFKPPTIEMEQFIRGGEVMVPVCDEPDKCLHPAPVKRVISGFSKYVKLMLIGTSDTSKDGILDMLISTSATYNPAQQQFIEFAPGSVLAQLRALASNPASARAYAIFMSDFIAAELAAHYVSEMLNAVRFAAAQNQSDLSLSQWMQSLSQRQQVLEAQIGNMSARMRNIEMSMTIAQQMRNNLNQRALKQTSVMPTITKLSIN